MNEQNIREVLQIILKKIQDREFLWRLEGSVNLRIQGVNVSTSDLDITTNNDGIKIFRKALKNFIVKDFFNQKINCNSLICDINHFEVEINCYHDIEKNMFDKIEKKLWNDLEIIILPLKYAKKFYELINYKQRVDLISKYLSN